MKTVLLLTDAGGDKLRIEVPEEKDMIFAACGAVCNVRIGKREFAPDAKQLARIVRVLRCVVDGMQSADKEVSTSESDETLLSWLFIGPGILRAVVGEYSLVVRPSWVHSGKYIGFVNGPGQTSITAGDNIATIDEAKDAVIAALRSYLVEMRKRIDAAESVVGGVLQSGGQ